jgi:hypothetical protein
MIEIPYTLTQILITLAIVLVIYYAYVILRYYREELQDFLSGKIKQTPDEQQEVEVIDPFERYQRPVDQQPIQEDTYQLAEELIIRVKEAISEASDQQLEAPEVLSALKNILIDYPTIKDEIIRAGVAELIISECKLHGLVSPGRSEVDGLWKMALG